MAATAADLTGANLVINHFILPLIFFTYSFATLREPTSCWLALSFNLVSHIDCCLIGQNFDPLVYAVVIIAYGFCGIEYCLRYSKNSPITSRSDKESNSDTVVRGICTKKIKHMAYAMVFMTTCLLVR